uniref:Uncharacterized protein n=1 Tax=Ananas comosus var. bracteatus TaxID=296719 RepID=A0A6V7PQ97_ANACO|nr:unnamed protein product [Ananas comosus var. bracteatus]
MVELVSCGKAKDARNPRSALEWSPREQKMQIRPFGRFCPRGPVSGRRDRSHRLRVAGLLMQPVPGREGPVPAGDTSENGQKLAKSRETSSRGPVSGGRTGLRGTGLSGKDRFPNAWKMGRFRNLRIVNSTVLEQWVECDRVPSHWTNFEDELKADSRPRVECGRFPLPSAESCFARVECGMSPSLSGSWAAG